MCCKSGAKTEKKCLLFWYRRKFHRPFEIDQKKKVVKQAQLNIFSDPIRLEDQYCGDSHRLGKLLSKEQQLSRTQHFILKAHAAIFVLHIQYGPRGTPLTPMIQRQNCLLSTSSLSKKTINILICFEK